MKPDTFRIPVDQLRKTCDPDQFNFHDTSELDPLEEVIGQDRAVRAVTFGIGIDSRGYHLFAVGPPGTGKTTTVQGFLKQRAADQEVPDDWCYVNNFSEPDKPRSLRLPAGLGCQFRDDMKELVEQFQSDIPEAFTSEKYDTEREGIKEIYREKQQEIFQELEQEAKEEGLTLLQTPHGLVTAPVRDGEALKPEEIQELSKEERQKLEEKQKKLQRKLRDALRKMQDLQAEAKHEIQELDKKVAWYTVEHLLENLQDTYQEYEGVIEYLEELQEDLLDNIELLKKDQSTGNDGPRLPEGLTHRLLGRSEKNQFDRYKVNLIVDNCKLEGAPVVLEDNPTLGNLLGRVEHEAQMGALITNFRMIKPGSLHRANGGYLIIEAKNILTKSFSWEALKRSLKNEEVKIENISQSLGVLTTKSLEPEPIPLNLKVILIGGSRIYHLLYRLDEDFSEIFKVKADFSRDMDRSDQEADQYARFVGSICREQGLRHFTPEGVARLIEESSRMVADQNYLSTKFGDIEDLIQQASYWAGEMQSELVGPEELERAVQESIFRSNRIETRLQRSIAESTLLIDTRGEAVGQVNGLSVLNLGDYSFGKPSRITCTTHVGKAGVINIERETKLGGRIHNKGVLILTGYLGGKYAGQFPLTLTARLAFEQQYSGVEGDSASCAELYTLLSSLSGLPLRQDLAVTGSVNQHGVVQSIGGVNQKIEGFFKTCQQAGLTGTQGVIIPETNRKNLTLREEVIQAVRQEQFSIYSVRSIDEGISLLTGKPAGEQGPDGEYPDNSVNGAVLRTLRDFAHKVKNYDQEDQGDDEGEGTDSDL